MIRRLLPPLSFLLVVSSVCLVALSSASAQEQRIQLKGKIKEVVPEKTGGKLIVQDDKLNMEFTVMITSRREFTIDGTAEQDYLAPGVDIEFVADLDSTGKVKDPLTEVIICAISEEDKALVVPADPTKKMKKGPGVTNKMQVRGTIKSLRDGKFTLSGPKQAVKGEFAPMMKITAHFTSIEFARPGDEAAVIGVERQPLVVFPFRTQIKMAEPLKAEKKGPPSKAKPSTTKTTSK